MDAYPGPSMADVPPPEQPGWYADAQGAWWWWDGTTWTPAPSPPPSAPGGSAGPAVPGAMSVPGVAGPNRDAERGNALLMWILYLVLGGWIVALIFFLISKEKPFVRHHSAEALNLAIVLLPFQVLGYALAAGPYIDWIRRIVDDPDATLDITGGFVAAIVVLGLSALVNYGLGILGAVRAHRGQWSRLPIGVHPVRSPVRKGEAPPYDVGG